MRIFGLIIGEKGKIESYLFLHRELINTLDTVFTGFTSGEFFFVQPEMVFEQYYVQLYEAYETLNRDDEVNAWLKRKDIKTTSLHSFRSLVHDFDIHIEFWNSLRKDLLAEKELVTKLLPHDVYVEKIIKLAAYELHKLLPEHKKKKEEVLQKINPQVYTWGFVSIDPKKAKLIIHDQSYDINPSTKEFLFLAYLIKNVGVVVRYLELASILKLNSYTENVKEDMILARVVQDIKKTLRKKLALFGVKANDIQTIMFSIRPITGSGYQLSPYPSQSS